MTDRNLHILSSPGFLIGLSLLLLNDFVLKQQFHNAVTGKLSDFAGLFVFSLFWIAVFPRHKRSVCISTALLFVFWKSAYSQFAIAEWNSLAFFGISRTVDYTDLWALVVIPLSYFYSDISAGVHLSRGFIYAIAIVSLVAFTATQFSHKASFKNEYVFDSSRQELFDRMKRLPRNDVLDSFEEGNAFEIRFDSCYGWANIKLEERENYSVITLKEMEYRCPSKPSSDEMRQYFEKEFIARLKEGPISQSPQILSIYATSRRPVATPSR
jgi:hypothetical protein